MRPSCTLSPAAQVRVRLHGRAPALVGQRQHERQGGVVEREGRGARHRARHVGDAVMHHAFLDIGRIANAMVGRDVSQQPPWSMAMSTMTLPGFIGAHHVAGDELGRGGAGHQHGADQQVGAAQDGARCAARVEKMVRTPGRARLEPAQRLGRAIDHEHRGAHAERDGGGMRARRRRRPAPRPRPAARPARRRAARRGRPACASAGSARRPAARGGRRLPTSA